jgi:hypothetical protein
MSYEEEDTCHMRRRIHVVLEEAQAKMIIDHLLNFYH